MNTQQEKLLIATLCGLVMVAAGAFAVQPAMAAGYDVREPARVTGVAKWDTLNMRKWPASYSRKTGEIRPGERVWIDRCITFETGADWCLVEYAHDAGWVNSRYLTLSRR
jgi:uncharacterized protein YraI